MAAKTVETVPTVEVPEREETLAAAPPLPTFPLEVGWKERYDPETGKRVQVPLTLLNVLYPPADEVLVIPQGAYHGLWVRWLAAMLESVLRGWLILTDVFIYWWRQGVPPRAPDLAAIPGGRRPEGSYYVNRDGPVPAFVVEITSKETRPLDVGEKPVFYAAMGVRELLVVDLWPKEGPWRLYGYRLEESPYYREIEPDEEGGLTFETVGLRFVAVGRERIEVYNAKTGERLLTPEEWAAARVETEQRARAAEERAQAEAAARAEAEARVAELEARLRELQARDEARSGSATEEM